jgi:hypothetical protein
MNSRIVLAFAVLTAQICFEGVGAMYLEGSLVTTEASCLHIIGCRKGKLLPCYFYHKWPFYAFMSAFVTFSTLYNVTLD